MSPINIRSLSLASAEFKFIRQNNQIYIDKTSFISHLASVRGGKFFIARPRRFGKSLLVSTFASLFMDGLKYFDGLEISKSWSDRTYPVLRLDLSLLQQATTLEELRYKLNLAITVGCKQCGLALPQQNDPFEKLINIFSSAGTGSLVLLIDEYDAPLAHHIHEPQLYEIHQRFHSDLFALIKTFNGFFRFLFVTGVGKFGNDQIYSGFNEITDLSLRSECNSILGITEEELERYYSHYLESAAQVLGVDRTALIEGLRSNYDGYCFSDVTSSRIYNPWSVLSFLAAPKKDFPNYWYKSGGEPSFLINYLQSHNLSAPETYFEYKTVRFEDLDRSQAYPNMNELCLLQQTGYLTIDHFEGGDVVLKYPNKEVTASMASLYSKFLLKGRTLVDIGIRDIPRIFANGTVSEVISVFNNVLLNTTYGNRQIENEHQCRNAMALILFGAGLDPDLEKHNIYGRSDLELKIANRRWVFEFKFAKIPTQEQGLLKQAVDQIRSRRYGEGDLFHREVIRIALVYSAHEKQITQWQIAD